MAQNTEASRNTGSQSDAIRKHAATLILQARSILGKIDEKPGYTISALDLKLLALRTLEHAGAIVDALDGKK